MKDLFSSLFEWFGLIPFYSKDLGEHLRGFDITCSSYDGTSVYTIVGLTMVFSGVAFYFIQYHAINSTSFNKRRHWWITVSGLSLINFLVAFGVTLSDFQSGNFCSQLVFSSVDCVLFGVSVTIWTWIWYALLTSFPFPRRFAGYNMTETTFWKP